MRGWYSWKIQKTFHIHPICVDLFVFLFWSHFGLQQKQVDQQVLPEDKSERIVHQHGSDDWTSCTWYGAGDLQKWWGSLHYTSLITNYRYFSWSTIGLVLLVCFFLFTNLTSNPRKVVFRSVVFPNSKSHFSSLFLTNCYRNQPFWRLIFEVMVVCFVGIVWTLLYSDALRGAFVTSKLSWLTCSFYLFFRGWSWYLSPLNESSVWFLGVSKNKDKELEWNNRVEMCNISLFIRGCQMIEDDIQGTFLVTYLDTYLTKEYSTVYTLPKCAECLEDLATFTIHLSQMWVDNIHGAYGVPYPSPTTTSRFT